MEAFQYTHQPYMPHQRHYTFRGSKLNLEQRHCMVLKRYWLQQATHSNSLALGSLMDRGHFLLNEHYYEFNQISLALTLFSCFLIQDGHDCLFERGRWAGPLSWSTDQVPCSLKPDSDFEAQIEITFINYFRVTKS